jgi:hypothetical protein
MGTWCLGGRLGTHATRIGLRCRLVALIVTAVSALVVPALAQGGTGSISSLRPRSVSSFALAGTPNYCIEGGYRATHCYSGTITYSRSFTVNAGNYCEAPDGTPGSESVAEQWQVALPDSPADPVNPIAVAADITGSYHETVTCPAGTNSGFDLNLSQPGTFPVQLTQLSPTTVRISAEYPNGSSDNLNTGGLAGAWTGPGGSGAPETRSASGFPGFGIDSTDLVVPTSGVSAESYAIPWSNNIGTNPDPTVSQPGTLSVSLTPVNVLLPTAMCDAYWARPDSTVSVSVPGVLRNDQSNGHGKLSVRIDHISFGARAHPYYLRSTGAVRFKAAEAGTAWISYHDVAADGEVSPTAWAYIYIEPTKPKKMLADCPGSASSTIHPVAPPEGKGKSSGNGGLSGLVKQGNGKTCEQTQIEYLHTFGSVTCERAVQAVKGVKKHLPSHPKRFRAGIIGGLAYTCDYDPGYATTGDAVEQSLDCVGAKSYESSSLVEIDFLGSS